MNQVTSLLDASSIYGSTAEEQHELRLMFKVENSISNIFISSSCIVSVRAN